jgi:lysophospholipase L1-like esterase
MAAHCRSGSSTSHLCEFRPPPWTGALCDATSQSLRDRTNELRTTDERQVHLIGWTTERHENGVIYENHGTIGATVNLLGQMSATTVAYELSDSCPSLVVIAFGTNEGFDAALDLQAYRASFATTITVLAAHAPQAAILVLGPPDGNQPDPSGLLKARGWRKPRNLAGVRRIQREIAVKMGWAFWDWSQAMGGTGSMHQLVVRDPPLALPDHMHLNKSGYAATADVLLFDLISAYERWRNRRSAP